jgi:hypothetical protein
MTASAWREGIGTVDPRGNDRQREPRLAIGGEPHVAILLRPHQRDGLDDRV